MFCTPAREGWDFHLIMVFLMGLVLGAIVGTYLCDRSATKYHARYLNCMEQKAIYCGVAVENTKTFREAVKWAEGDK